VRSKYKLSQYFAEFIGTFFLIFFGCGSMVLAEVNPSYDSGFIPVIWGGAVLIMIYAVGHISGAHFNPAVTLSFWVTRKFPSNKLLGYLSFQVMGGLLACLALRFIFGGDHHFGATVFTTSVQGAFVVELILSFALMFVIMSVATDARAVGELAGIAIGATVGLCAFVGGPLTNASMNPARSIAPAIFSGDITHLWLYILSPIIGAILGAKTYEWIRCQKILSDTEKLEKEDSSKHGCC
tara:strand:+ start:99430 stop:100146 length:717 start_codon:yes stop_codon:yes gene_type:complete